MSATKRNLKRSLVSGAISGGIGGTVGALISGGIGVLPAIAGTVSGAVSSLNLQEAFDEILKRDARVASLMKRLLFSEFANTPPEGILQISSSTRKNRRSRFIELAEEDNPQFSRIGDQLFATPPTGIIKSQIYDARLDWVHLNNLSKGEPLRVHCPAIHPAAAAALLHMREFYEIEFESLDFSGGLGVAVLRTLSAKNVDYFVLAESPVFLWSLSRLLEDICYVGTINRSFNKLLAKSGADLHNIKWAFYQPGTSGHDHLRFHRPGWIREQPTEVDEFDLTSRLEALADDDAVSVVCPAADAFLSTGNYAQISEFPHRTSLFASRLSPYFTSLTLNKSFSEVFTASLLYCKKHPRTAYRYLSSDMAFSHHFEQAFFGARNLLKF